MSNIVMKALRDRRLQSTLRRTRTRKLLWTHLNRLGLGHWLVVRKAIKISGDLFRISVCFLLRRLKVNLRTGLVLIPALQIISSNNEVELFVIRRCILLCKESALPQTVSPIHNPKHHFSIEAKSVFDDEFCCEFCHCLKVNWKSDLYAIIPIHLENQFADVSLVIGSMHSVCNLTARTLKAIRICIERRPQLELVYLRVKSVRHDKKAKAVRTKKLERRSAQLSD